MKSKFICVILAALWAGLLGACGGGEAVYEIAAVSESSREAISDSGSREEITDQEGPGTIFIYVCGAVRTPGVYELPAGSRVFAALEAAGGMTGQADPRSLNQAEVLEDGQQITVYTREEAEALPPVGGSGEDPGKVNLNTASLEELMTLPGIGEAKAGAIIAYREEHGDFQTIEEIQQVEGIKEKVFEKIKEQIEI